MYIIKYVFYDRYNDVIKIDFVMKKKESVIINNEVFIKESE